MSKIAPWTVPAANSSLSAAIGPPLHMLCFLYFLVQHRQLAVLPHHFGPIHSICIALLCSTYGGDHALSGRTRFYGPKSSSRHPVVCKKPQKSRSSLSSSSPRRRRRQPPRHDHMAICIQRPGSHYVWGGGWELFGQRVCVTASAVTASAGGD